jgi:hypothetical protein
MIIEVIDEKDLWIMHSLSLVGGGGHKEFLYDFDKLSEAQLTIIVTVINCEQLVKSLDINLLGFRDFGKQGVENNPQLCSV